VSFQRSRNCATLISVFDAAAAAAAAADDDDDGVSRDRNGHTEPELFLTTQAHIWANLGPVQASRQIAICSPILIRPAVSPQLTNRRLTMAFVVILAPYAFSLTFNSCIVLTLCYKVIRSMYVIKFLISITCNNGGRRDKPVRLLSLRMRQLQRLSLTCSIACCGSSLPGNERIHFH